jgi:AcrR family transcriptional regulator
MVNSRKSDASTRLKEGRELPIVERPSPARAELRRQNIKEVARQLFVERGFHLTGVALIAKESGVAVQQLYRDFPSKEDIIAAIADDACKRFADLGTLNAAVAADNRKSVLNWLTSATCREDEEGDRLFLEIVAEASRSDRVNTILSQARQKMSRDLSRAFAILGGAAVNENHHLLAEAFIIILMGSLSTRELHREHVQSASSNLVACLLEKAGR